MNIFNDYFKIQIERGMIRSQIEKLDKEEDKLLGNDKDIGEKIQLQDKVKELRMNIEEKLFGNLEKTEENYRLFYLYDDKVLNLEREIIDLRDKKRETLLPPIQKQILKLRKERDHQIYLINKSDKQLLKFKELVI